MSKPLSESQLREIRERCDNHDTEALLAEVARLRSQHDMWQAIAKADVLMMQLRSVRDVRYVHQDEKALELLMFNLRVALDKKKEQDQEIKEAVAEEREACALLASNPFCEAVSLDADWCEPSDVGMKIAIAIRARGTRAVNP